MIVIVPAAIRSDVSSALIQSNNTMKHNSLNIIVIDNIAITNNSNNSNNQLSKALIYYIIQ